MFCHALSPFLYQFMLPSQSKFDWALSLLFPPMQGIFILTLLSIWSTTICSKIHFLIMTSFYFSIENIHKPIHAHHMAIMSILSCTFEHNCLVICILTNP